MATIDIDRDAARDAAEHELSSAIYPKGSLSEQLIAWIERLLYRITAEAASVPGGWFTVTILLILLAAAVLVAVRTARRAMRTSSGDAGTLFDDHELSAAQHRARALQYATAADWSPAIRHRLRAVARQLEESGVLAPAPGRTASELARTAAQSLPRLAGELASAADAFNDVTYGELPGHQAQYTIIATLDDELGRHPAPVSAQPAADRQSHSWAQVR